MSHAIEMLEDEHRVIEKVLDAIETWVLRLDPRGEDGEKQTLQRFVNFFRGFADRCHHGKEEEILFQEMTVRGFSETEGPVAVLTAEHERGRSLVGRLDRLSRREGSWNDAERRDVGDSVRTLAELFRPHIVKEDSVVFPLAEVQLGEHVMESIGERFESFEREQTGEGEHRRLHELAEELIAQYTAPAVLGGAPSLRPAPATTD